MKSMTQAFAILLAVFLGAYTSAAKDGSRDASTSSRPNILLVIGDDIGMDATTSIYPGMIDDLVKKYGPSGRNHPDYGKIAGKPASTPVMDKFARQGMRF